MAGLYHAMFNLEIPMRRLANENKELFQNDKCSSFIGSMYLFNLLLSALLFLFFVSLSYPLRAKRK